MLTFLNSYNCMLIIHCRFFLAHFLTIPTVIWYSYFAKFLWVKLYHFYHMYNVSTYNQNVTPLVAWLSSNFGTNIYCMGTNQCRKLMERDTSRCWYIICILQMYLFGVFRNKSVKIISGVELSKVSFNSIK